MDQLLSGSQRHIEYIDYHLFFVSFGEGFLAFKVTAAESAETLLFAALGLFPLEGTLHEAVRDRAAFTIIALPLFVITFRPACEAVISITATR